MEYVARMWQKGKAYRLFVGKPGGKRSLGRLRRKQVDNIKMILFRLIPWVPGALSPEEKWQWHETDHSPPTCAEVKKKWIYTATPHTSSWHSA
jgi:hypothetical protein